MFDGWTVAEGRRVERALRADGYCGRLGPFDQGAHNRVASWCARPIGECKSHDYKNGGVE